MHFSRYLDFWPPRLRDQAFMECAGETLSWTQLDEQSRALAAHLQSIGVSPGDRLGCLLGNSLAWCITYAASLRVGSILVPLNAMFGPMELQQIARDADCAAIVSTHALMTKLDEPDAEVQGNEHVARVFDRRSGSSLPFAEAIRSEASYREPALSDDDVMLISYTSGTTGVPKGAALTHRAVDSAMQGLMLNFGLRGGGVERMLILAPLAFTGGVISNLSVVIATGGSGWLEQAVDPARAAQLLAEKRITVSGGVPALWERIAMAPSFADADLTSLRAAYTGGAPVPRPLLETFRAKGVTIRQQYGFTEACGGVSSADEASAVANPGSCGQPLPAMRLRLRAADETIIREPGVVGEVEASGSQLLREYWNKPEETAAAFTDDGWYRTGDLGQWDSPHSGGGLVIVDRKKNMLISGGVNIYPAEVERALLQIESVTECVVFGMPSQAWGEEVVAIVHARGKTGAEIQVAVRDLIGSVKAPKRIVLSPEPLPRTASGKIARTGLAALAERLTGPG